MNDDTQNEANMRCASEEMAAIRDILSAYSKATPDNTRNSMVINACVAFAGGAVPLTVSAKNGQDLRQIQNDVAKGLMLVALQAAIMCVMVMTTIKDPDDLTRNLESRIRSMLRRTFGFNDKSIRSAGHIDISDTKGLMTGVIAFAISSRILLEKFAGEDNETA